MRRRRSGGTWLPTIGTSTLEAGGNTIVSGRAFIGGLLSGGVIDTQISPITIDEPFEGDFTVAGVDSMADVIGSEYTLKRIVGKIFVNRLAGLSAGGQDQSPAVLVSCGFFVARANDEAVGGGAGTPIGSATAAERRDNYSPLETDTMREPWIWRRTWILGSAGQDQFDGFSGVAVTTNNNASAYPASTALYGSVADGPHIDSKVKRRIGTDDRLWFVVSSTQYPLDFETDPTVSVRVRGYLDYRLFGALRRARGKSSF